jgi:hypothetical protein
MPARAAASVTVAGATPERNFLGATCIEKRRHPLARALNGGVHRDALRVAPAALHVVLEQMRGHGIEHALRHLRTGGIVEKDAGPGTLQRGELCPQRRRGKVHARGGAHCAHEPWYAPGSCARPTDRYS